MNVRPILFSGPMVRALLEGRKTQTRRIVKPSVKGCTVGAYIGGNNGTEPVNVQEDGDPWIDIVCPYGQRGDLLWVRETWCAGYYSSPSDANCGMGDCDPIIPGKDKIPKSGEMVSVFYRADFKDAMSAGEGYFPSIHMPRWASRLTLRIKDVRVERLKDITEENATAEGIVETDWGTEKPAGSMSIDGGKTFHPFKERQIHDRFHDGTAASPSECLGNARFAFANLWERINGEGAWDTNPWVWALTFSVVKANVDEVLRKAA